MMKRWAYREDRKDDKAKKERLGEGSKEYEEEKEVMKRWENRDDRKGR